MSTQNALIVSEIGKPLTMTTRLIPVPKENEILVKVMSAGLNPHDQKVRDAGLFIGTTVPAIIANDIAGIVSSLGPNVTGFGIGDHVFGQSKLSIDTGGLQQYVLLDADVTAHVPQNISDGQAATLPVNGIAPFIAFFDSSGLGIPAPFADNTDAKAFDYAAQTLVIIGGGVNTGKLGIQLASLAGIGKIVAVASASNAAELKSYGATHVIDRHATNEEIKSHIQSITGDDLLYVYDAINVEHTLAVSLLSSARKGKVATLLPGKVDSTKIGEKKAGFGIGQTFGSSHLHRDLGRRFWKELPGWVESGKLKPLSFKIVEGGLSVEGVNRVLDDYRDGKNPGKWHVHPNG